MTKEPLYPPWLQRGYVPMGQGRYLSLQIEKPRPPETPPCDESDLVCAACGENACECGFEVDFEVK